MNNYLFFSGVGDCVILLKRGREMEDVLPKHHPIEREERQRIHVSVGEHGNGNGNGLLMDRMQKGK